MLIVCPNCQASYRVSVESLGTAGRTVRCAKCNTAWFADNDSGVEKPAKGAASPSAADLDSDRAVERPEAQITSVIAGLTDRPDVSPSPRFPKRTLKDRARKRLTPANIAAGAGLAFMAALFLARVDIVRLFPQTAAIYGLVGLDVNVRGLAFQDIDATERVEGGVAILLVSGRIQNITKDVIDVPRLRLSVRNMEGRELYVWTVVPRRTRIVAGDTLPFQAQLAAPPAESRDVAVRFLARHDAIAGIN